MADTIDRLLKHTSQNRMQRAQGRLWYRPSQEGAPGVPDGALAQVAGLALNVTAIGTGTFYFVSGTMPSLSVGRLMILMVLLGNALHWGGLLYRRLLEDTHGA